MCSIKLEVNEQRVLRKAGFLPEKPVTVKLKAEDLCFMGIMWHKRLAICTAMLKFDPIS
jgi:hypothetical protein